jgi:hypothetical protein
MSDKAAYDLWWKNAVVYCLDVETFFEERRPFFVGRGQHL